MKLFNGLITTIALIAAKYSIDSALIMNAIDAIVFGASAGVLAGFFLALLLGSY